jgi:LAO/AO transport system kinase
VSGFDALPDALAAHRVGLDVASRRGAARRAGALADFVAERGDAGLRALGGRRAGARLLAEQDPAADIPTLLSVLESEADA